MTFLSWHKTYKRSVAWARDSGSKQPDFSPLTGGAGTLLSSLCRREGWLSPAVRGLAEPSDHANSRQRKGESDVRLMSSTPRSASPLAHPFVLHFALALHQVAGLRRASRSPVISHFFLASPLLSPSFHAKGTELSPEGTDGGPQVLRGWDGPEPFSSVLLMDTAEITLCAVLFVSSPLPFLYIYLSIGEYWLKQKTETIPATTNAHHLCSLASMPNTLEGPAAQKSFSSMKRNTSDQADALRLGACGHAAVPPRSGSPTPSSSSRSPLTAPTSLSRSLGSPSATPRSRGRRRTLRAVPSHIAPLTCGCRGGAARARLRGGCVRGQSAHGAAQF